MSTPILQFGTSRFLLAHVALFVSEALERGDAIGGISVVQTTANEASRARIAALRHAGHYPVQIRGREGGGVVDRVVECRAVRNAWSTDTDWAAIRRAVIEEVRVIVSNTSDAGYQLDERDCADLLANDALVPHSYPAKLLVLLHARWRERPQHGVSVYPCELVDRNGDTLRDIVLGMARQWSLPEPFIGYLQERCVWVNSLVDRIVSAPIDPVGAVAEPYALWAIERREGMELPCTHEQIVLTDELRRYAQLKLFFLNLGHTWLADQWLSESRSQQETVLEAMSTPRVRDALETVWHDEVLPVFDAMGLKSEAHTYIDSVRERFLNPFLAHRISDIAANHREKIRRRIQPLVELAGSLSLPVAQPRLRALLAAHALPLSGTEGAAS
ncbi:mannitol dehydrogenase family protein [Paraburkholderia sp. SARCC-3016]|uniref:mannitol dehydrogenase family protein n=1 Tax=Paraburkholderia sp. SARCC-3016 TaxID=3058611 RepID=UPI002806E589|nr:mannitol dehydrogenase family protein [Paraburkholderia sp. SARCC-3016]MDQ7982535.1 mannitol dehydrogenase family protein [Paraburkholderia sp. SARCC-3016]